MDLPEMRPALIGTGPKALINLIDGNRLMEKGLGDGIVMFRCVVGDDGNGYRTQTYRGTPNSKELAQEILDKIPRSKFMPAVYQHRERWALLSGTVTFGVSAGKPHVRIFLNQDAEEMGPLKCE